MASFNQVVLVGNVTRDIELRYLADGTAVTDVGLAVSEKWKAKDGTTKEDVLFIDCTCWARTAEIAAQYLAKGSPVLFGGKLKQDRWEKDGQKFSKIKLTVERLQLIGQKGGGGQQQEHAPPRGGGDNFEPPDQQPSPCAAPTESGEPQGGDNLPF